MDLDQHDAEQHDIFWFTFKDVVLSWFMDCRLVRYLPNWFYFDQNIRKMSLIESIYSPYLICIRALASGIHACAVDTSSTSTARATAMFVQQTILSSLRTPSSTAVHPVTNNIITFKLSYTLDEIIKLAIRFIRIIVFSVHYP